MLYSPRATGRRDFEPTREENIIPLTLTLTLTENVLPKGQEKVAYRRSRR
jgi:hypothetical protein